VIERGFLPHSFHSCTFTPTLSQEAWCRCFNGLLPLEKLSPYRLPALSLTSKPGAYALLRFITFQVLPRFALPWKHLPSNSSHFTVPTHPLAVVVSGSPMVSLQSGWLSPLTGADLLDVSGLSSPQPLRKVNNALTIFSSRGRPFLNETHAFSLHASFLFA